MIDIFLLEGEQAMRRLAVASVVIYEKELIKSEDLIELYESIQKVVIKRAIQEHGLRYLYLY